jgi:hypothetical protein
MNLQVFDQLPDRNRRRYYLHFVVEHSIQVHDEELVFYPLCGFMATGICVFPLVVQGLVAHFGEVVVANFAASLDYHLGRSVIVRCEQIGMVVIEHRCRLLKGEKSGRSTQLQRTAADGESVPSRCPMVEAARSESA